MLFPQGNVGEGLLGNLATAATPKEAQEPIGLVGAPFIVGLAANIIIPPSGHMLQGFPGDRPESWLTLLP